MLIVGQHNQAVLGRTTAKNSLFRLAPKRVTDTWSLLLHAEMSRRAWECAMKHLAQTSVRHLNDGDDSVDVCSEGGVKRTWRERRGLLWGPMGVEGYRRGIVEDQCACR